MPRSAVLALAALLLSAAMLPLGAQPPAEVNLAQGVRDLASGAMSRTAFLNREAYDRYCWAASQTQPSDFFFGGLFPDFYFILQLRNPGPVAFITPYEYTRPEEVQALLAGLEQHHVKTLLWTPALDVPTSSQGDHLPPLRLYIRQHYHVSSTFPEYQVWTRND